MSHSRWSDETGSAAIGFALVFPLLAFVFISATDLITSIVKRETATAVSHKVLREGVRLPHTENVEAQVLAALEQSDFNVSVKVSRTVRNTAMLVRIDIESIDPQFSSRIFGLYEQVYE